MRENRKLRFAVLVLILGMTVVAPVASAATTTIPTTATIMVGLSLTCPTDGLRFGDLTVGSEGGTAVVDFKGVRTVTGDVGKAGGEVAPAFCTAEGSLGRTYTIALPTEPISLSLRGGSDTMTVTDFTATTTSGRLNDRATGAGTGTDSFAIGGTLNVNGNQTPGLYEGTFPVTVAYS